MAAMVPFVDHHGLTQWQRVSWGGVFFASCKADLKRTFPIATARNIMLRLRTEGVGIANLLERVCCHIE